MVEYIKEIEKQEGVKIGLTAIFDPLISYLDGNENDSVQTRATLDGISRIASKAKVTPILIHHANKGGNEYRGSTAINDWARNRISLTPGESTKPVSPQKTDSVIPQMKKTKLIKVTHEKCNNFESFDSFLLEMGPDLNFRLVEKQLSENDLKNCEQVVKVLKDLGCSASSQNVLAKAYVEAFNSSEATAKRYIKNAEKAGYIYKEPTVKDGKDTYVYSLPKN